MELLSLLAFLSVAMGGGFILYNRQNKRPIPRWIVTGHGLGAAGALLLLITAVLTSNFEGDTEGHWLAIALLSSVVIGSYGLFRKLLNGKRKPLVILYAHGLFAVTCIGSLAYALA